MMRRGQAAMEFLMTYGWAILALLVMMGALAYFGIVNPKNLVPERCLLTTGVTCRDFQAVDTSGAATLSITLENKAGEAFTIEKLNVTTQKGGVTYQSNCGITAPTVAIGVDEKYPATCTFAASSSTGKGTQGKFNIEMTYKPLTGTYNHTVAGLVTTVYQ